MDLRAIYAAQRRIGRYIRETPLERSQFLSEFCGGDVWLKLENQQLTGSFKVRGATNKLLQLSEEERTRGIVTASAGNHAQGVGYAAKMLGVQATVVVPENTPIVKRDAIMRYGVNLIVHGEEYLNAEKLARSMERERGMTFVSAYNDVDVIIGQGTIGLELIESLPDVENIIVPVGGGGLISGVGCAMKSVDPSIEVIGVQSVASPVMYESIKQDMIVEMELEDSVAEGLHGGIEEGSVTFELCKRYVGDFILVEEKSIVRAMNRMFSEQNQIVEGAGAVGVAAILENPSLFRGRKTGVVISGGNVEPELLVAAIREK